MLWYICTYSASTNKHAHIVVAPFRLGRRVERVVREQIDLERIPATPPPFRASRPLVPLPVPRVVFGRRPQQSREEVEARRGVADAPFVLALPFGNVRNPGACMCAPERMGGEGWCFVFVKEGFVGSLSQKCGTHI